MADLDRSLAECSRIIKTRGQFIQTVNLDGTMIEFYAAMEKVLKDLNLDGCLDLMRKQIYKKRKPIDEYLGQIMSHGFLISSVKHDKFEYKFVDGTTMLNHHFIRLAFLDGWKNIVPTDKQTHIFGLIENELNAKSKMDGILTLSVPFVLIDCTKQ